MRKALFGLAALGLLAAGGVSACDSEGEEVATVAGCPTGAKAVSNGGGFDVGVILPDTTTSQRWKSDDPKLLKEAFEAAGVPVDIQNAENDKCRFQSIADGMIASGVKVLMIVNLDSASGKIVLDKAKAKGIATIDYDRLTLNGGADYYVSFDNVKVGELQGEGLVRCLTEKKVDRPVVAELNGSPTDNNATEFKQGYDSVLDRKYSSGEYSKGPDQSVPGWVNKEGGLIFEQMFSQFDNITGVVAANDGLANAVIGVLKKKGLNGKIPVTGQDATVEGLQNVLAGDQCMTIYKAIKPEATEAANLAISLVSGKKKQVDDKVTDPESGADVATVALDPKVIFPENVKDVVADGFVAKKDVCTPRFADLCEQYGVK
jgi:D-xylose transport system substrate-binding protein